MHGKGYLGRFRAHQTPDAPSTPELRDDAGAEQKSRSVGVVQVGIWTPAARASRRALGGKLQGSNIRCWHINIGRSWVRRPRRRRRRRIRRR